jgi:hypothetical protein
MILFCYIRKKLATPTSRYVGEAVITAVIDPLMSEKVQTYKKEPDR